MRLRCLSPCLLSCFIGGVSLAKSGLVPIGRGFVKSPSRGGGQVDTGEVNFHLLPTNQSIGDTYGSHCASRPEKAGEDGK